MEESTEIHIESIDLNDPHDKIENKSDDSMESKSTLNQSLEPYTFSSLIMNQINTEDSNQLLNTQRQILSKLDLANKSLLTRNKESSKVYNAYAVKDFQSYITTLHTMKQDLEFIFKRIRMIKAKLELKYPSNFSNAVSTVRPCLDDEDEDRDNFIKSNEVSDLHPKPSIVDENETSKDRASSVQSNESSSQSILTGFIQTARERINSVSSLLPTGDNNNPETDKAD